MLKSQIKNYTLLVIGIISIILSVLVLSKGRKLLELVIYLIGGLLIITNLLNLLLVPFKKYKFIDTLIKTTINVIFGISIMFFSKYIITSFTLIFALYTLLISIVNIISYVIYVENNIKGKLNVFINAITSLIFTVILLINPTLNIKYVLIILSIYLMLYGLKNIINFIFQILPKKITNKIKARIDFPIPLLIAMFIPKALLKEINEILKVDKEKKFDYKKNDLKPKLFVIIHLAKSGSASFGHIEVSYNGKIYSYGNYNKHSRHLFDAIGDGIILVADKEKYIDYCIHNKKRYLIEFGIVLTEKEEKQIEKRINKLITENTEPFYSDLELYEKGKIMYDDFNDMSSEIYKYANGKYYRITKGKNKIFFVLKNNCAQVAEQILKGNGKRIIKLNGIISPGTYYDYLNQAFLMKNSNVVTKKVYMEE
ncbi:MAG: hypothetical protein MR227_02045 [Firmicutes bacterium]|nr:hypothetical protein [Bacillota bacterium]